jgi:hypothetical protein
MRRSIATRLSACAALALVGLVPLGCSQTHYFRSNPSPNTSNLESSSDEIDNRITLTNDTNLRALSNDMGRLLLLDKPSSLTLIPAMPHSWN